MTNQPDLVEMLASAFAVHLPVLVVCLVCIVIIPVKSKRQESSAPLWALLGFGLAAALCVTIPCVQTALQVWAMNGGEPPAIRTAVFTGTSILWSVLRAATYALLLAAVLAGRPPSPAGSQAPGGLK